MSEINWVTERHCSLFRRPVNAGGVLLPCHSVGWLLQLLTLHVEHAGKGILETERQGRSKCDEAVPGVRADTGLRNDCAGVCYVCLLTLRGSWAERSLHHIMLLKPCSYSFWSPLPRMLLWALSFFFFYQVLMLASKFLYISSKPSSSCFHADIDCCS